MPIEVKIEETKRAIEALRQKKFELEKALNEVERGLIYASGAHEALKQLAEEMKANDGQASV